MWTLENDQKLRIIGAALSAIGQDVGLYQDCILDWAAKDDIREFYNKYIKTRILYTGLLHVTIHNCCDILDEVAVFDEVVAEIEQGLVELDVMDHSIGAKYGTKKEGS